MSAREIHLELLLSRSVVDRDGKRVGRIEEFCAEDRQGEFVVTEYLLGAYAVLDRLAVSTMGRAMLNLLRMRSGYRVPWDRLDLSDHERPRLTCSLPELQALQQAKRG